MSCNLQPLQAARTTLSRSLFTQSEILSTDTERSKTPTKFKHRQTPEATLQGTSGSSGMGLPTEDNIYGYSASKPAAIVFTVLNSALLTYHGYLSLWLPCRWSKTRLIQRHRYTICLWVACCFSTAGYSIRQASISNSSDVALYATQSSYVVISPIFVCASLYWQLKYLVLLLLPRESGQQRLYGINPLWLGRIFISSDVTSFLTQGAGSGVASSGNWEGNTSEIGLNIILAGLALQLATFTFYMIFLGTMVFRARKFGGLSGPGSRGVRKVLIGVWAAAVFGQVRTIFRMVEFALGIEGYPFQNEWMLYILDSVPMVLALAFLGWYHPITHLQAKRFFEDHEGGQQVKGDVSMTTRGQNVLCGGGDRRV